MKKIKILILIILFSSCREDNLNPFDTRDIDISGNYKLTLYTIRTIENSGLTSQNSFLDKCTISSEISLNSDNSFTITNFIENTNNTCDQVASFIGELTDRKSVFGSINGKIIFNDNKKVDGGFSVDRSSNGQVSSLTMYYDTYEDLNSNEEVKRHTYYFNK